MTTSGERSQLGRALALLERASMLELSGEDPLSGTDVGFTLGAVHLQAALQVTPGTAVQLAPHDEQLPTAAQCITQAWAALRGWSPSSFDQASVTFLGDLRELAQLVQEPAQ